MNRLNELAGLIDRGALAHGDRIELAAILRSAAKADAGMTEWHLVVGDARTSRHNAEVNAARARIAAVEAERDAALASLSAKQRAIDETLRWLESVKNDDMAYMVNLLRPHATPAASPVGNAASPQVSPVGSDTPSRGGLGEARDTAIGILRRADAERSAAVKAEADSQPADDTRERIEALERLTQELASSHASDPAFENSLRALELVALLADFVRRNCQPFCSREAFDAGINALIAAARKGAADGR